MAEQNKTKLPDLSEYIARTPKRMAKNKTFYLDVDVIEALKNAAKQQNITDSRLCNDILRTVLGL